MNAHGLELCMPLSHRLPEFLQNHPLYDSLLRRLADFVRSTRGALVCIDVGANIGDSIAACYPQSADHFLAIEPHQKYAAYLRKNWEGHPGVRLCYSICSSDDSNMDLLLVQQGSSAHLATANQGACSTRSATLDTLSQEEPFKSQTNLIKIDTDGHDFAVLLGARSLISRTRPSILFECDFLRKQDYAELVSTVFTSLARDGYSQLILYDNLGHLFGVLPLSNTDGFEALLRYARQRRAFYWDALAIPAEYSEVFYRRETDFAEAAIRRSNAL
jgi:FkbM family methyltransferase